MERKLTYFVSWKLQASLSSRLFDIGANPEYWEVLRHYPGAQWLAGLLSPKASTPEFSLETQLRQFSEHQDERIRRHFKHIPPYLRDLLWHASHEYTRTPGTYNELVYGLLADVPHEVLFLTLNYDTLLEQALQTFDSTLASSTISAYIGGNRQAKVIKLHGSIDWFREIGSISGNWFNQVESQDVSRTVDEDQIIVRTIPSPISDHPIDRTRLYPILTAPLAGKSITDMVCPDSHVAVAKDFLKSCQKFLIIGTSGLDDDLMNLLDSSVQPRSVKSVHLVSQGNHTDEIQLRFIQGVHAFGLTSLWPKSSVSHNGFRQYISSEAFRQFCNLRV